jgi:hypothetical protein
LILFLRVDSHKTFPFTEALMLAAGIQARPISPLRF